MEVLPEVVNSGSGSRKQQQQQQQQQQQVKIKKVKAKKKVSSCALQSPPTKKTKKDELLGETIEEDDESGVHSNMGESIYEDFDNI